MPLDDRVMDLAAGEQVGKHMPHKLADAQLALRRRTLGSGLVARHVRCPLCGAPKDSERALHRLGPEALDDVADPHVLVILECHSAFLSG